MRLRRSVRSLRLGVSSIRLRVRRSGGGRIVKEDSVRTGCWESGGNRMSGLGSVALHNLEESVISTFLAFFPQVQHHKIYSSLLHGTQI